LKNLKRKNYNLFKEIFIEKNNRNLSVIKKTQFLKFQLKVYQEKKKRVFLIAKNVELFDLPNFTWIRVRPLRDVGQSLVRILRHIDNLLRDNHQAKTFQAIFSGSFIFQLIFSLDKKSSKKKISISF